jgi:gluconate 2-dehydrogenase gamma chain
MSMADWAVVGAPVDPDDNERLFFSDHEWETIEAATARIMPTDHDLGAREAAVVRLIDRYLSGIDYVFAAPDGSGFLQLTGKYADAWRARVGELRATYREGVPELDRLADELTGGDFVALTEDQQDDVLVRLSGEAKPTPLVLTETGVGTGTALIFMFDDGLPFFDCLILHTRQGFYGDPVYGGNRNRVGWDVIGFPGPRSLKDTLDGTFSVREYFESDYDWADLVPHLRARST